jgi:multidrug efflux pump subunit AcrA (membrane-fusion protein)
VAEVRVKEGEQVAAGQVLAVLEAAVTETSDAS